MSSILTANPKNLKANNHVKISCAVVDLLSDWSFGAILLLIQAISMNDSSGPRTTQIMDRSHLNQVVGIDGPGGVMTMIEGGEEARRIFATIADEAAKLDGVTGAAVLLASDRGNGNFEIVAVSGEIDQVALLESSNNGVAAAPTRHSFDVICLGAPVGVIVVESSKAPTPVERERLMMLAHHTSVVFERQRLSNTLQHFLDRLQVLNEINQLIASNVGLQRIVKSIARESAFRFAADVALTFILNEEKNLLEIKGGYGCAPHLVPKQLSVELGVLGQAVRSGGHLSIPNIANYPNHKLEFLEQLEIKSIDVCCLEVRGEALGVILIGYRRETAISAQDLTRFEEFCQGAAVAIANARTQERIHSYTERLEELVDSRTADLAVQTAKAEEANRAKSQFLANMSHELRTPLTAIVGYSSVIVDGIFGELNDKQRDALNAISRSSDHLKNLIDDVLNLARIESGKEQAEPTRVSLKDLLTQTHKLMMQTAIGKGVSIRPLEIKEELKETALWADSKHIHQILINLISNAVKYTPKGGAVRIESETIGDMVKISVCDTGVGIPASKIGKLFERFERGEDAYSKSQEGTGIGLNLTQHLVELNGGRIGVESKEGEGSRFWILMPIAAESTATVTQKEVGDTKAVRLDGLSVLVVDDNTDTCEVLRQVLIAAGGNAAVCTRVKDAVIELQKSHYDIVLTDLALPGDSGLVLIEHIRSQPGPSSQIPIIVLSACAFETDRDAALEAGGSLFIAKPFKPSEVIRNVRSLTLASILQGKATGINPSRL